MCKYHVDTPLPSAALMLRVQDNSHPAHFTPYSPSHSLSHPLFRINRNISVLSPLLQSVMSTCIASVSHKLESADHLAYGEETQAFRRNDASRHHLLGVHVPDRLQHVVG